MAHTEEKADVLKVVGWIEERLAETIALEDAGRLVADHPINLDFEDIAGPSDL
ncbi:hypothetical protein [Cohnella sp.]|uniref:hypothetical protein n=1 Tax=Cohnella sp. TaxID=1883426 RepID=UPI0035680584